MKKPRTIGKNLAGPIKAFTNVSSNLFVVLFEIISNFLIISLLIKPLKIKKIKKFLFQSIFEKYLHQEYLYSIPTKIFLKNYLLIP